MLFHFQVTSMIVTKFISEKDVLMNIAPEFNI
jgi:hypothetical protein